MAMSPQRTSRWDSDARVLQPGIECLGPDRAICGGCQAVSSWMKMTVDKGVRGEKVLRLFWRFESLHLALAAACRTMRVLGSVVQISALAMFYRGKELAVCHAVASQLIGHDHARDILKAL